MPLLLRALMWKDVARSLLALATHGDAGQTPYVLADAMRLIQQDGWRTHLVHLDAERGIVHLLVQGRNVYVRLAHHGDRIDGHVWTDGLHGWLWALVSTTYTVPDVFRRSVSGQLVRATDVITDWTKQWPDATLCVEPTESVLQRCATYVSTLTGETSHVLSVEERVFLDERRLAAAVTAVMRMFADA